MLAYVRNTDHHPASFNRKYERKHYNTDLVFAIGEKMFQGRLRDISVGGAFIYTKNTDLLLIGDLATISIPFTDGSRNIKRTGRILWKNSTGFAVTFSS